MESISIANKILQNPTRSYKILRDTRQKYFGIHINSKQDPKRSFKIIQDSTRCYKILRDTRQKCSESISIANQILQDPTRFYGILDKNARESISIANKILQDSTGY